VCRFESGAVRGAQDDNLKVGIVRVFALEREPLVEGRGAVGVGVLLEQKDAAPGLVVDEQEMGHEGELSAGSCAICEST